MRVAALCAGYGGLELGLGHDPAWVAETDPDASQVLAEHWPDAPNHGDITTLTDPPPADIVTAGFPCQPVSTVGRRKGTADERWIFDDVVEVVRRSGARAVVLENVLGLLSANGGDAMGRVVSGLASLGFDAEWTVVRASDIGAPHRRARWFCVAYASDVGHERAGGAWGRRVGFADGGVAVAYADGERLEERRIPAEGRPVVADPPRGDRFGPYAEAVHRWERILGRPAPPPLQPAGSVGTGRLNPVFVEWMMGLPEGWVTDIEDLSRSAQLRILGNGVVPQQAAHATRLLTAAAEAPTP